MQPSSLSSSSVIAEQGNKTKRIAETAVMTRYATICLCSTQHLSEDYRLLPITVDFTILSMCEVSKCELVAKYNADTTNQTQKLVHDKCNDNQPR